MCVRANACVFACGKTSQQAEETVRFMLGLIAKCAINRRQRCSEIKPSKLNQVMVNICITTVVGKVFSFFFFIFFSEDDIDLIKAL